MTQHRNRFISPSCTVGIFLLLLNQQAQASYIENTDLLLIVSLGCTLLNAAFTVVHLYVAQKGFRPYLIASIINLALSIYSTVGLATLLLIYIVGPLTIVLAAASLLFFFSKAK
jgi:hypothetical protein